MTTNEIKNAVKSLDSVTVQNKYGDEIAEGRIIENSAAAIVLENGDCIPFRHIAEVIGNTLKLSVAL